MKKFLSAFLVFIMTVSIFTTISTVTAFAEDDPISAALANIPADAFKGDYTESTASDGSVTRVFRNGGVLTKYADGTSTSVDQNGNQYRMESDGTYSIRTTNGYKYTSYKDGRESLTEPKGMTTTFNTDGSYSEVIPNGMITDFDADGNVIGAGVVGSDERIGVDENGIVKNGEIKGPNGVELIITDQGVHVVNENGDVFDYNNADGTETVNIKYTDGTTADQKITKTDDNEIGSCVIVESDGTRWEGNVFSGVDQNGVPQNVDTMRWIGADGRSIWIDNNTKAIVYKDENGDIKQFIADGKGNLTDFSGKETDWKVSYDENGNIKDANISFPDGTKLVQNPDGSMTIVPSNGTIYESDGKGNVTKNGEPIKKDGEWVNRGTDTTDRTSTDNTDSAQWNKDKQTLENAGYEALLFTNKDTLSGYEMALKVDEGSLVAYIETTSPNRMAVYYFKSASLAAAKYDSYKNKDNKVLRGNAIIIDDVEGILTGATGELKTRNETFFGVTLPIPDIGTVTEFNTEVNGWGEEATTIRIDGMSYEQYIEYCKILEALPGWEVYEYFDTPEDVAHFPEDYNSKSTVDFTGNYKSLPHVTVKYYSDKMCESNGYPHFCMFVFRNFD